MRLLHVRRCEQLPPGRLFQRYVRERYGLRAAKAPKHKFRFKSKLFGLDATTIKLCLSLFPWASFRQAKGGVKMHTLLDQGGHIPAFATITDAKTHESRIAKALELPKGSIVVFDAVFPMCYLSKFTSA